MLSDGLAGKYGVKLSGNTSGDGDHGVLSGFWISCEIGCYPVSLVLIVCLICDMDSGGWVDIQIYLITC